MVFNASAAASILWFLIYILGVDFALYPFLFCSAFAIINECTNRVVTYLARRKDLNKS